jgi:hypothetical protein
LWPGLPCHAAPSAQQLGRLDRRARVHLLEHPGTVDLDRAQGDAGFVGDQLAGPAGDPALRSWA